MESSSATTISLSKADEIRKKITEEGNILENPIGLEKGVVEMKKSEEGDGAVECTCFSIGA